MRILVTGAAGYIGRAVTFALLKSGHQVVALDRHHLRFGSPYETSYHSLEVDIWETKAWEKALHESTAVVHLAAADDHADKLDYLIVSRVLEHAATSTNLKCFVYTSGTMPFGNTGMATVTEDTPFGSALVPEFVAWRPAHESLVLSSSHPGFRAIIVRPGFVYGNGNGIYALLLDLADSYGCLRVPGSGAQRWPLVHVEDIARLYVLIVARGENGVYHGVGERAVCVRDFAQAAADEAGFPQACWRPWPLEEARREIGSLADGLALDQCIGAPRAYSLGWLPQHQNAILEARTEVQCWKRRNLT
jgi:nucleoside-diphosphate-sugar epimerase